jgi:lambda family phage minor tail protein L
MTSLTTEGLVTLYQLDTSPIQGGDGTTFYFTSAEDFDHVITWGGQQYSPVPMDASGFEMTTQGTIPQPSVTISNIFGAANLLIDNYQGLIGALLSRILTLRRFLDDGATPDPNTWITWDKFVVAQKTSHNAMMMVFKLAARWDSEGTQLPRRQILRDVCSHTYRFFDQALAEAGIDWFNYSKATCPYTGSSLYDTNNNPTDPQHDQCSRTLQGCRLRFGYYAPLPARFFPGVGKVK